MVFFFHFWWSKVNRNDVGLTLLQFKQELDLLHQIRHVQSESVDCDSIAFIVSEGSNGSKRSSLERGRTTFFAALLSLFVDECRRHLRLMSGR